MLSTLEKIVLYLIDKSPGLGRIQLWKGLFFADSIYYAYHKESMTGITYIKEKQGPVPDNENYEKLCYILKKEYIINNIDETNYRQKSCYYLDRKKLKEDFTFTEDEEKILNGVVRFISNKTARKLSELTHGDVYDNTAMRDIIPLDKVVKFMPDSEIEYEPSNIKEHFETIKQGLLEDANFLHFISK